MQVRRGGRWEGVWGDGYRAVGAGRGWVLAIWWMSVERFEGFVGGWGVGWMVRVFLEMVLGGGQRLRWRLEEQTARGSSGDGYIRVIFR